MDARPSVIILASGSPRRRELLALTGWQAEVRAAEVDETPRAGESAQSLAVRLARAKASLGSEHAPAGSLVLAADTVVSDNGTLLGKPATREEALGMLAALRGHSHTVITGLALVDSSRATLVDSCATDVPMREYSEREARAYVESGEALDKAGAYAIQDPTFQPVSMERMRGCFANVMGLPLCHVTRTMRKRGVSPMVDVPSACRAHTGYACEVYPRILEGQG